MTGTFTFYIAKDMVPFKAVDKMRFKILMYMTILKTVNLMQYWVLNGANRQVRWLVRVLIQKCISELVKERPQFRFWIMIVKKIVMWFFFFFQEDHPTLVPIPDSKKWHSNKSCQVVSFSIYNDHCSPVAYNWLV